MWRRIGVIQRAVLRFGRHNRRFAVPNGAGKRHMVVRDDQNREMRRHAGVIGY
jgi:hypothetical protein